MKRPPSIRMKGAVREPPPRFLCAAMFPSLRSRPLAYPAWGSARPHSTPPGRQDIARAIGQANDSAYRMRRHYRRNRGCIDNRDIPGAAQDERSWINAAGPSEYICISAQGAKRRGSERQTRNAVQGDRL